jgi:hypothetical protein
VLRSVVNVAVKKGVRYGNTPMEIKKAKVTIPHLDLPLRAEFLKFVEAIDNAGVWVATTMVFKSISRLSLKR